MTRVPHSLLRDTITIADFRDTGSRGPLYGNPRSVRASVQSTSRFVEDGLGRTVPVDALVIIRPEAGPVRPESRVSALGTTYRVVRCYAMPDSRRPSHYELALARAA